MIADILKRRNKESYMSLVRSSAFKVHLEFRFMTSLRDPLDLPGDGDANNYHRHLSRCAGLEPHDLD